LNANHEVQGLIGFDMCEWDTGLITACQDNVQ
jgi:hypothetical protein